MSRDNFAAIIAEGLTDEQREKIQSLTGLRI